MRKNNLIMPTILLLIAIIAVGYSNRIRNISAPSGNNSATSQNAAPTPSPLPGENVPAVSSVPVVPAPAADGAGNANAAILIAPLSQESSRVTKKSFGIKVSPQDSPVQPEKFSGYHTGVDFEILPGEENIDVPIFAVCSGTLIYKKYVSGYGGVMIESCKFEGKDVTVLYGHLQLSSIADKLGDEIKAGDKIAILGEGYGQETDGERKHLHLAIHIGTGIELRGYVQTQQELGGWIDAMKYVAD